MGAACSVDSWRLVAERGVSPAVVVVRLPKRLKDLERENATLKRLLADAELEKAALRLSNDLDQLAGVRPFPLMIRSQ
jgi:hypothetical protein